MRLFSLIITWVFLPLFVPIYTLSIVLFDPYNVDFIFNPEAKWAILKMYMLFFTLAPGFTFLMFKRRKIIDDLEMSQRKQRNIPLLIVFLYSSLLLALLYYNDIEHRMPLYLYSIPLIGSLVSWVFYLINFWKKISLHAGTIGMAFGFLLAHAYLHPYFNYWFVLGAVFCSGLVLTSRLYLQKHKPIEVYFGWGIASFLAFIFTLLTKYILH